MRFKHLQQMQLALCRWSSSCPDCSSGMVLGLQGFLLQRFGSEESLGIGVAIGPEGTGTRGAVVRRARTRAGSELGLCAIIDFAMKRWRSIHPARGGAAIPGAYLRCRCSQPYSASSACSARSPLVCSRWALIRELLVAVPPRSGSAHQRRHCEEFDIRCGGSLIAVYCLSFDAHREGVGQATTSTVFISAVDLFLTTITACL